MIRKTIYLFAAVLIFNSCRPHRGISSNHNTKDPVIALDTVTIRSNAPEKKYNASATRVNDLIHTKLEINFNWERSQLNGKATLDVKPYFYPTDTLVLDAKGMDIKEVSMIVNGEYKKVEYKYNNKQL